MAPIFRPPSPASADPLLIPQGDYAKKPPLRLQKSVVVVGSEEHCHLHLVSSSVSRHHALIIHDQDGVYIRDLGSRTKVIVNGQPQRETLLSNDDLIQIGRFSFKFSLDSPAIDPAFEVAAIQIEVNGKPASDLTPGRTVLIGRGAGCDIALTEDSVSQRHAIIFTAKGKRYIRDLNSRTGIFVNGERIRQHEVEAGVEVRIGETVIAMAEMAQAADVMEMPSVEPLAIPTEAEPVAETPTALWEPAEPALEAPAISDGDTDAIPLEAEPPSIPEPSPKRPEQPPEIPEPLKLEVEPETRTDSLDAALADAGIGMRNDSVALEPERAEQPPDVSEPLKLELETETTSDALESALADAEIDLRKDVVREAPPDLDLSDISVDLAAQPAEEGKPAAAPVMADEKIVAAPEPIVPEASGAAEPPIDLNLDLDSAEKAAPAIEPSVPQRAMDEVEAGEQPIEIAPTAGEEPVEKPRKRPARGRKPAATSETPAPKLPRVKAKRRPPQLVEPMAEAEANVEPVGETSENWTGNVDVSPPVTEEIPETFITAETGSVAPALSVQPQIPEAPPAAEEASVDVWPTPARPPEEVSAPVISDEVSTEPPAVETEVPEAPVDMGERGPANWNLPASAIEDISAPIISDDQRGHGPARAVESEISDAPLVGNDLSSGAWTVPAAAAPPAAPQADVRRPAPPAFQAPFSSLGGLGFIGGMTVTRDHFLGGMPIKLPPLPPTPFGFGQVRIDTSVRPAAAAAPPPSVAPTPPPPVIPAAAPQVSAPTPPPPVIPAADPQVSAPTPPPPPVKPRVQSPPSQSKPPPVSFTPRPPRKSTFATDVYHPPEDLPGVPRPAKSPGPSAFEGLAMGADVFSASGANPLPINDAPFGGASMNRPYDFGIPESAERADRAAENPEEDFAEDDFWNRTDEEDGAAPATKPVIRRPGPPQYVVRPEDSNKPPQKLVRPEDSNEPPQNLVRPEASNEPLQNLVRPEDSNEPLQNLVRPEDSNEPPENPPTDLHADSSDDSSDESPTDSLGDALEEQPVEAQLAAAAAATPVRETPRAAKRRRFRIPFLMPIILLGIGVALAAIWRFVPVRSQSVGTLTFVNFNYIPGTQDSIDFEAAQRRFLDDQTRENALEIMGRDNPGVAAGFLKSPALFDRVAATVSFSSPAQSGSPQTLLQMSSTGGDKEGDLARMLALLQSLADRNAPQADSNRQLRQELQSAQQTVDDAQQKVDSIKSQLSDLMPAIEAAPPADQLAQLATKKSVLEQDRLDAAAALNRDRADLVRPAAPTDTTTQPAVADPQLRQMRQQLADLSAEMDSSRSDQLQEAAQARGNLEDAARQFDEQIVAANTLLDGGSQLRQFVDSAMDSQSKARDLIDTLIVDGEDLEQQLEDTRRDVDDLIQSQQAEKWAIDPQLQSLRENLESAQHRYNANAGQGITDARILDPLQKEIDDWTAQVKARQAELGADPGEIRVEASLNNIIDALRKKLAKEKHQTDEILDPLQKQLANLDPAAAALPAAEQDLARRIHQRLDALNDARQKFAETFGENAIAPSAKVMELQKRIAGLKADIAARQADMERAAAAAREAWEHYDPAEAQARVRTDQENFDATSKALEAEMSAFDDAHAKQVAADAAQQKKVNLLDDQQSAEAALETARKDRDEKQSAADHAFEIKPVTSADVATIAPADPRMMYSAAVMAGGLIAVALVAFASHGGHRGLPKESEAGPDMDADFDSLDLGSDDDHPATA